LGWVSQLMGWVGSGHTKWTHGQLWSAKHRRLSQDYGVEPRDDTGTKIILYEF